MELPIFFNTDQTTTLKDCGIEYSLSDCDIRMVSFYVINAAHSYFEDEKEYTMIHTGNGGFVCNCTYEEFKIKWNH